MSPLVSRRAPSILVLVLLVVTLSGVWSIAFPLIHLVIQDISPFSMVAWRLTIAGAALWGYRAWLGLKGEYRAYWREYFFLGFIGNTLPFILIGYGMKTVSAPVAALMIGTVPLQAALLSHFIFADERLNVRHCIGITLGFCGLVVLFIPGTEENGGNAGFWPIFALLLGSFCYAVTIIAAKRYSYIPLMPRATGMMLASAIAAWVFVGVSPGPSLWPEHTQTWVYLIILGLLPSALAVILLFYAIEVGGVMLTSSANYLTPALGVVASWLVLGDAITIRLLAALLLIVMGMAAAQNSIWTALIRRAKGNPSAHKE